jgi:hypothetical protein
MEKIEKGEKKIQRATEISEALHKKIEREGPNAFQTLTVSPQEQLLNMKPNIKKPMGDWLAVEGLTDSTL